MPSGPATVLELLDNGAAADTTADDGIYSRYFTTIIEPGRYAVKCEAWGDENSAFINSFEIGAVIGRVNSRVVRANPKVTAGSFNRVADGGSFKVNGFHNKLTLQLLV